MKVPATLREGIVIGPRFRRVTQTSVGHLDMIVRGVLAAQDDDDL